MSATAAEIRGAPSLEDGQPPTTGGILAGYTALITQPSFLAWSGIALASGALRLWLIDRVPLNTGEAEYAFAAWQSVLGQLRGSLVDSGAPLLSHALALAFMLFGPSDVTARLISALAGVGLAVSPALLTSTVGSRTALLAGLFLAFSPIPIHLSRLVDPAELTALIVMVIVAGAIRLLTDRPPWSLWALAVGVGLGLASESASVIALAAAAIAALATWSPPLRASSAGERELGTRAVSRRVQAIWPPQTYLLYRGPWALGIGLAVVAATGAFMDLRGLGFILGDLWGGAAQILTPVPFPAWNLVSLLAYSWPLLILGLAGFIWRTRAADRVALFFGQWALLLIVLAGAVGDAIPTLALLPVAPIALLAGMAVARLPLTLDAYRLAGGAWVAVAVTGALAVGAWIVVAHTVGGGRPLPPLALVALALLAAAVVATWRQNVLPADRIPALAILGVLAYVGITLGAMSRLSFGGSPPGTELLVREHTHSAFRAAFRELNVLASADPRRVLVIEMATPVVARWYGRWIPGKPRDVGAAPVPFVLRDVPPAGSGTPAGSMRTPWRTVAEFDQANFHPLGIVQWMVSRTGLVKGRTADIIVTR